MQPNRQWAVPVPSVCSIDRPSGWLLPLMTVLLLGTSLVPSSNAVGQEGFLKSLMNSTMGSTAKQDQPDVTVLLFTQENCPPCRHIAPMIDHLIGAGFPIQKIDVAATPGIAHQWSVTQTPTLVVVADGEEVQRQHGVVTAHQVGKMLIDAGYDADLSVLTNPSSTTPLRTMLDRIRPGRRGHRQAKVDPTATIPKTQWTDLEAKAMAASVRIKVNYQDGAARVTDFGTGTVIHRIENELLILTCGHVFRDSQGEAKIEVDLGFDGGDSRITVPASLLMFDAGAPDVAIICATTDFDVQPVGIATAEFAPDAGDSVFTVGCDHGAPATIRRGNYLTTSMCGQPIEAGQVDNAPPAKKYDVSGRPVVGRSGGGLFNQQGELIGVCNAAVIDEDQGVYSSVLNVHQMLTKANLSWIAEPEFNLALAAPASLQQGNSLPQNRLASLDPTMKSDNRFRPLPDGFEQNRLELRAQIAGDELLPSQPGRLPPHRLPPDRLPNEGGTMRGQSLK